LKRNKKYGSEKKGKKNTEAKQSKKKNTEVKNEAKRKIRQQNKAKKKSTEANRKIWKQNDAKRKIWEAKRSEKIAANFSLKHAKLKRNEPFFASLRFEEKKILKRNRRTLMVYKAGLCSIPTVLIWDCRVVKWGDNDEVGSMILKLS
jgi:flagellar biosynthesis GTPase FlhF